MTWEQACKLSRFAVAVRNQTGRNRKPVVRWTSTRDFKNTAAMLLAWKEALRGSPKFDRTASVRYMPPSYAGVHADWEPLSPKDAITLLGDIARENA